MTAENPKESGIRAAVKHKRLTYLLIGGTILLLLALLFIDPSVSGARLEKRYGVPASDFIQVNGIRVHYHRDGKGPVLLLLHGTASSLYTWNGWATRLSGDFEIIRLDLPGFGLTGPNKTGQYDMDTYSQFLDAFLDSLHIDQCFVAGNSLGGEIAWNYALYNQRRVQKLILVDPGGYVDHKNISMAFKMASTPLVKELVKWVTPANLVRKSLKEVYYNDDLVTDSLVRFYRDMTLRKGNRGAFVDRVNTIENNRSSRLGELGMPVLIQWGEKDQWIPLSDGAMFESSIPEARMIVYPNAGHIPMEEIPELTASDARKFLFDKPVQPTSDLPAEN